ncbi:Dip2/Utp12 protein [Blomia tropicalis]|nr:Dip2/Utp12 protein [Blomia tropicalis]
MGITKQYLRWEPGHQFGIIGSQNPAICLIKQWPEMISTYRICATAACENIAFWDLKTCELVEKISTNDVSSGSTSSPISCLAHNSKSNIIASGHADGSIRLFDLRNKELQIVFSGHKGFVSCMAFDSAGLRIASAGKDGEIVVWDVANNSGLFRLRGHKGSINKVEFMHEHPSILISASNDTFGNLNTQHCFKTLNGHRNEVWSFALYHNDTRLISGGSDSELKVWKLVFSDEDEEYFERKSLELKERRLKQLELIGEDNLDQEDLHDDVVDNFLLVERYGTIMRKSTEKVSDIIVDQSERLLICHGKDQYLECFKLRNEDEIKLRAKNRLRKERKRKVKDGNQTIDEDLDDNNLDSITLSDEILKLEHVRTSGKVKSIDLTQCSIDGRQQFRIAVLHSNNSIEFYQASFEAANTFTCEQFSQVLNFGHRSDVRTIAISSDSLSILTGSADSLKLWNKSSCRCVATITEDVQYPLCSVFAPGDKHVLIGTKFGTIQIVNLSSLRIYSTIEASVLGKPIWSMCIQPDLTGIVTASEDKFVKFWNFDLVIDEETNSRQLTLNHDRSLEADDGVLCVKMTPNSKFVAASLLDSTVKIYFADTFKFFLSLYGHKFPVLCMDISSDSRLIVTGSSDKNIKIWGMDFGDCHRSLFAHDDNIMCLSFIPRTHQLFTAGKDCKIKMWDADNFEKVMTLDAHHGEIWSMAVAPNGKYLVSASHDKTIRTFNKTNEPLILEEEKEMENERLFEKEFEETSKTLVPGESGDAETDLPQKKTVKTVRSVERLIEAIDIFIEENEKMKLYQRECAAFESKRLNEELSENEKPIREPVNPHLLVYRTECPYRYMLEVLIRIKSNEIEETLLELPFNYIQRLLSILHVLLNRRWEVELACRCICFIIRVNFGQITSTSSLVVLIDKIRTEMHQAMIELTDLLGVNTIGLEYHQSIFEFRSEASLFSEMLRDFRTKRNKKKHKSSTRTAPILTWT